MGFFSWITSDTGRSIPSRHSVRPTFPVHVLCPDGGTIEERSYEGYGRFGGHDIHELLVDWNRDCIDEGMVSPDSSYCDERVSMIRDMQAGMGDAEMGQRHGRDWKRMLGIGIQGRARYGIKIVEDPSIPYGEAELSRRCPEQGYFYPEMDELEDDDDWW